MFLLLRNRIPYPPADRHRRSTFILDMSMRFCKNISGAKIRANMFLPWLTKLNPSAQELDVGVL